MTEGPLSPLSPLAERSRGVVDGEELQRFLDTFLYTEAAFLVDEIRRIDRPHAQIEAILETTRWLPFAGCQRVDARHPAHVSGAELLMATGSLGCLHAWFFHGCRWDQGWAGFGNRIHRADFKKLARIGPPIEMVSRETRTRVGPARVVGRFEFEFRQEGDLVYQGDQSAMFVKARPLV